jgi:predicted dehydrogenase
VTKNIPTMASLGTGMMGQLAHLANYARLRDAGACRIAGVTDLNRPLAEAVAEAYRVPRVYSSAEELLSDPAVDGVACIQQWPNNYSLVKLVLEAGKSVITEKPMVGRVDEAEELVDLAQRRGVHYAVGFMKRYDPGVELAKGLIDEAVGSGSLGALLAVDSLCNGGDWLHNVEAPIRVPPTSALPEPAAPTYPDACRTHEARVAYDWLLNIFSHTINLCHFLLGREMAPASAQFRGGRAFSSSLDADGVLVTIRGAMTRAHEWREETVLVFERGEIRIVTPTPMNRQRVAEVSVRSAAGDRPTTVFHHAPIGWAFFRQAEGFVGALAGGEPPRTPAAEALKDVRVMQRIIEIAEIA